MDTRQFMAVLGLEESINLVEPGTYALPDHCPACGEAPDHCLGHGMMGDPRGYALLTAHGNGDHSDCHPVGCDG